MKNYKNKTAIENFISIAVIFYVSSASIKTWVTALLQMTALRIIFRLL